IRQATTQISSERDAAVRQIATSVRTEQQELTGNLAQVLSRAIDRMYSRSIALLCFIVVAMVIYRLIAWRLPSPGSEAKPPDDAPPATPGSTKNSLCAPSGWRKLTLASGSISHSGMSLLPMKTRLPLCEMMVWVEFSSTMVTPTSPPMRNCGNFGIGANVSAG